MTTCLGKSCSFGLPCMPFVDYCQFMYYFLFGFEGRIWDLIVSVPDHCLSFYFSHDEAHIIMEIKPLLYDVIKVNLQLTWLLNKA